MRNNDSSNSCTEISREEVMAASNIKGLLLTRNVPYSFNISDIPSSTKDAFKKVHPNAVVIELSKSTQVAVSEILKKWTIACNDQIKFHQEESVADYWERIVIVGGDNLTGANGVTFYSHRNLFFKHTAVCFVPTKIEPYNNLTISHELGHAIGLNHFHDVDSLASRLKNMPEGLGCSVMPYKKDIITANNRCQNLTNCNGENYAIYPGLMDAEVCQRIYKHNFSDFLVQSVKWGTIIGSSDGFIKGLVSNIKLNNHKIISNEDSAKLIAQLTTSGIIYSFKEYTYLLPTTTFLSICSFFAKNQPTLASYIIFIRNILIYGSAILTIADNLENQEPISMVVSYFTLAITAQTATFAANFLGNKAAILGSRILEMANTKLNDMKQSLTQYLPSYRFFNSYSRLPVAVDSDANQDIEMGLIH